MRRSYRLEPVALVKAARIARESGFCGGQVPIRLGTTVTAFSEEANQVNVGLADGSSGTYDLGVGADGIHSSIRQLVFGAPRPRHLGQVSWRFMVDYSGRIDAWTAMSATASVPPRAYRTESPLLLCRSPEPRNRGSQPSRSGPIAGAV